MSYEEVYILLKEGDVIQEGDEAYIATAGGLRKWQKHHWSVGSEFKEAVHYPYRRKVKLPQWPTPIKFSERMPEEGQMIRAFESVGGWGSEQCYTKGGFHHGYYTHWFAAEPPPKPEAKKEEIPGWIQEQDKKAGYMAPQEQKKDLLEMFYKLRDGSMPPTGYILERTSIVNLFHLLEAIIKTL